MDNVEQTRDFAFFFDHSVTAFYEEFDYNSLSESARSVPPHPDDRGAETAAIQDVDHETGEQRSRDYYGFEWDIGFNFLFCDNFLLKYQFGIGTVIDGNSAQGEGRYQYPPAPRQRYESGENALTFITINTQPIISNYLSLGYFGSLSGQGFPYEDGVFTVEAGVVLRTYALMRGWDRYAAVEEMDTVYENVWGGYLLIQYQKDFYPPGSNHVFTTLGIGARMILSQSGIVLMLDVPLPPGFSS